jgi:low temperature requirement protein LtrA
MTARDPKEAHRASTPLELFFDLTFVAAVAQAAASLQHGVTHGDALHVLLGYPLVFFAIWWAWMNFTWFASAYDVDDVGYRLAVLGQMTGVLILAAGVPRALEHWNFSLMVVGYVIMRLSMVSLWLRAAASDAEGRKCAQRYAIGIALVQVGWVIWLPLPPDIRFPLLVLLAVGELLVPLWAESAGRTSWHAHHIAERYGLFTIIVLGEVVLAVSLGVHRALSSSTSFSSMFWDLVGSLLIVFSMWWFYFDMPSARITEAVQRSFSFRLSGAFAWGYGHYVVFMSAAAVGAGLTVALDQVTGHSQLTSLETGFVTTIPVAVYVLAVWALHARYKPRSAMRNFAVPVAVLLIITSSFTGQPTLSAGIVMTVLVCAAVRATSHQTHSSRSYNQP